MEKRNQFRYTYVDIGMIGIFDCEEKKEYKMSEVADLLNEKEEEIARLKKIIRNNNPTIENVGIAVDDRYIHNNYWKMKGTIYFGDDTVEDIEFTYFLETGEIYLTKISDIYTDEELEQIKEILEENIEINFKGKNN